MSKPGWEPEWAAAIAAWAAGEPRISAVYLYGSRVKGAHRPDSDLDVALIISGDEDESADAYWFCDAGRLREEVDALVPVEVHLEMASEGDSRVMPAVRSYGVRIYAAPGFSDAS